MIFNYRLPCLDIFLVDIAIKSKLFSSSSKSRKNSDYISFKIWLWTGCQWLVYCSAYVRLRHVKSHRLYTNLSPILLTRCYCTVDSLTANLPPAVDPEPGGLCLSGGHWGPLFRQMVAKTATDNRDSTKNLLECRMYVL